MCKSEKVIWGGHTNTSWDVDKYWKETLKSWPYHHSEKRIQAAFEGNNNLFVSVSTLNTSELHNWPLFYCSGYLLWGGKQRLCSLSSNLKIIFLIGKYKQWSPLAPLPWWTGNGPCTDLAEFGGSVVVYTRNSCVYTVGPDQNSLWCS